MKKETKETTITPEEHDEIALWNIMCANGIDWTMKTIVKLIKEDENIQINRQNTKKFSS